MLTSSMQRATGFLAVKNQLALAGLLDPNGIKHVAIALFLSYVIVRSVALVIVSLL